MPERIENKLRDTKDLYEARQCFVDLLKEVRNNNLEMDIIYISGIITSGKQKNIENNLGILKLNTERIRDNAYQHRLLKNAFIFSATDIFNETLFKRFDAAGATNDDYLEFWLKILRTEYVNKIIMTPMWDESDGATKEYELAKELSLEVLIYSPGITSGDLDEFFWNIPS